MLFFPCFRSQTSLLLFFHLEQPGPTGGSRKRNPTRPDAQTSYCRLFPPLALRCLSQCRPYLQTDDTHSRPQANERATDQGPILSTEIARLLSRVSATNVLDGDKIDSLPRHVLCRAFSPIPHSYSCRTPFSPFPFTFPCCPKPPPPDVCLHRFWRFKSRRNSTRRPDSTARVHPILKGFL